MDARRVLFDWLLVALHATGRLRRHIVIRVLGTNVRVAIGARVGQVDRGLEPGFIAEQGDFLASRVGLGERLVRVTFQAGVVGVFVGYGGEQTKTTPSQQNQNGPSERWWFKPSFTSRRYGNHCSLLPLRHPGV